MATSLMNTQGVFLMDNGQGPFFNGVFLMNNGQGLFFNGVFLMNNGQGLFFNGVFPMYNGQGPFFNGVFLMDSGQGPFFNGVFLMNNGQGLFLNGPWTQFQPQPYSMPSNIPGPGTQFQIQQYPMPSNMPAERNTYYHHTDEESARKILEAGKIKQSETINGDAVRGTGVYLNQLGPSISRSVVAKNNFDGRTAYYKNKIQDGKVDVAIEMQLPKDKVQDFSSELNRNVFLHRRSIRLSDVQGLKVHVRSDTTYTTYEPNKK